MSYLKAEIFIPAENSEELITALNQVGLLKDGNYDYCYAATPVKGHFRPLDGANPFIGEVGEIAEVDELKVEFRIKAVDRKIAEMVILEKHPYETPVVNFIGLV